MLSDAELAAIAARRAALSPGPWAAEHRGGWWHLAGPEYAVEVGARQADAVFWAGAAADVDMLLAEVRRLRVGDQSPPIDIAPVDLL